MPAASSASVAAFACRSRNWKSAFFYPSGLYRFVESRTNRILLQRLTIFIHQQVYIVDAHAALEHGALSADPPALQLFRFAVWRSSYLGEHGACRLGYYFMTACANRLGAGLLNQSLQLLIVHGMDCKRTHSNNMIKLLCPR